MGALYYTLIALLMFCFLVWNNKRKSEHWDDVICVFYVFFSAFWIFYLPIIFIIKCLEGIAKGIRNE